MNQSESSSESTTHHRMSWWKPSLVALTGAIVITLIESHRHGFNGPWYWAWRWREPRVDNGPLFLGMVLLLIPLFAAQKLASANSIIRITLALGLLMATSFGVRMLFAAVRSDLGGLQIIDQIVQEPHMSSYYADAAKIWEMPLRKWMSEYPTLMSTFELHTKTKPAGTVLYWYTVIHLFNGPGERAAMAGGIFLGAIATLSIPATFFALNALLNNRRASFCAASYLAISPGFIVFFPMYDPAYTILSMTLIGCWWLALQSRRTIYAVAVGIATSAALVFAFNVLMIGIFMLGLIALVKQPWKQRMLLVSRQAAIVAATTLTAMGILWLITGYNPVLTFVSAWNNQHELLRIYADQRPYPATALFDLTDFILGSGYISVLLVVFYFFNRTVREHRRLVILAIGQLVIVAITGLLQSETSRVWNFMLPLLLIGPALELSGWTMRARISCYFILAMITAALYQNMTFLF